jgi:hypothetical protein
MLMGFVAAAISMHLGCSKDEGKVKLLSYGGTPIQVSAPTATQCTLNPGTIEMAYQDYNTGIKWQSMTNNVGFNIVFQAGQDPSNPGSPNVDTVSVPSNGTASQPIQLSASAQTACTTYGMCAFPYTIVRTDTNTPCTTVGSGGVIVKPAA